MKENLDDTERAPGKRIDRWTLMEKGRLLHDKAVCEMFAKMFKRSKTTKAGSRLEAQGPRFNGPFIHHQSH